MNNNLFINDEDNLSRIKLTNVLDKNFIVEAGAGSGKTTALVKRMVAMVESGIDVSTISCITFTKAAANEFYERFQKLLSLRSDVNYINKDQDRPGELKPVTKESCERCNEALKNIDLCFMGTIDSFVQKLMNEHPYEFKVPSNVPVMDEDEENEFIKKEYYEILNGKYDNVISNLSSKVEKASQYIKDVDSFIYGIKYFKNLRSTTVLYSKPDNKNISLDEKFKIDKKYIFDGVSSVLKFYLDKKLEFTTSLIEVENKYRILNSSWDKNYFSILNLLKKFKKDFGFSKKYYDAPEFENIPGFKNIFYVKSKKSINAKFNPDYIYNLVLNIENTVSPLIMEAFDDCAKVISEEFSKNGLLTFSDFIITLRDNLKDDANKGGKIIKYIQQKRKYYLLDEFQDTNPIQTEIFFYLTASNIDLDFTKCNPIPGSLFIVGDPKQSIYRFTGADVTAFLNTKKLFNNEDSEVLYLSRNFRSTKNMKVFFNDTLNKVLDKSVDKTEFKNIPYDNNKEEENNGTLKGLYYYNDTIISKKIDDNDNLVKIIKAIVNNDAYKIYDKNSDNKTRKIKYEDIMIITPNKTPLRGMMKAFGENNIPYFMEGATAFEESSALNEIKDLFNAIILPYNKELVYLALLTSYISLNEKEIMDLFVNGFDFNLTKENNLELIKDNNIKDKYNKLVSLYKTTYNMSYSSKFLYLIENINIYERNDTAFMEYVYYAYELLKQACINKEVINAEDAYKFVDNINSDNRNYERCFSLSKEDELGKVHVANLHKTKGLEAEIVILANPKLAQEKPIEFRTERNGSNAVTYVISIIKDKKTICNDMTYGINKKDAVDELPTNKCKAELLSFDGERRRLEYVAATRAKQVLIIADLYKVTKEKGREKAVGYWNDMFDDYKLIKENIIDVINSNSSGMIKKYDINDIFASDLYKEAEEKYKIEKENSKKQSYKLIRPSELKIKKSFDEKDKNDDQIIVSTTNDSTIKGTLVHRLMELVINSKNKMSIKEYLNIINNEFSVNEYNDLLEKIYNKEIENKDSIINIVLNSKEAFCEVPFSYMEENNLYHGIIDLIYLDNNDKYHVIDYKTNKESNLEKLENEYKGQLDTYIKALKKINDIDADAHIYHIDIN